MYRLRTGSGLFHAAVELNRADQRPRRPEDQGMKYRMSRAVSAKLTEAASMHARCRAAHMTPGLSETTNIYRTSSAQSAAQAARTLII